MGYFDLIIYNKKNLIVVNLIKLINKLTAEGGHSQASAAWCDWPSEETSEVEGLSSDFKSEACTPRVASALKAEERVTLKTGAIKKNYKL